VDLHHLARALRCAVAPQLVDEPLGRDDPARIEEQQRQQRSLLGAAERDRAIALARLQRAE
jgi:hypothetical protein